MKRSLTIAVLAVLLASCEGPPDVSKAERECANGVGQSCVIAGTSYALGHGVARDIERAARLLETGARQGHGIAQLNYASMFEGGLGVALDRKEAYVWYQAAARKGVALAKSKAEEIGDTLGAEDRREADRKAEGLP